MEYFHSLLDRHLLLFFFLRLSFFLSVFMSCYSVTTVHHRQEGQCYRYIPVVLALALTATGVYQSFYKFEVNCTLTR